MKKEDTLALKGVAIIMMLLYHLFYVKQGGDYYSLLSFSGMPLIKRFSEICYPVPLYVMLSGYGLYASYASGKVQKLWKRALALYFHLWIIYLIFIPLGCWLVPDKYPGSVGEFFKNFFSIRCSYNTEQWFLFPYLLLMFFSKPIFRLIDSIKPVFSLLLAVFFELFYIGLYKMFGLDCLHEYLGIGIQLLFVISFLLPFSLGALARKCRWVEKVAQIAPLDCCNAKRVNIIKLFAIVFLMCVIVIRMFVPNQSLQILVVFLFMLLFPLLRVDKYSMAVLQFLGKHSLNIWLIHTWLCYYLFKDIIYGLKYPILIFVATLLLSLLISIIVEIIYKKISIIINKEK